MLCVMSGLYGSQGPYVTGSYLNWYSKLEQLPIVTQGNLSNGSSNVLKEMNYNWESGLKAGIGYNFCSDNWDLFLNWTYIRPTARGNFHVGPGSDDLMLAILADGILQGNQIIIIVSEQAESKWSLNFNTLDFELGKEFCVGRYVTLRPFAGVKAGILKQRFHVAYHDNLEFDVVAPLDPIHFDLTTQDFTIQDNVVGPRIGVDSRWNFCGSSFAFLANGSVSLMWNNERFYSLGTVGDLNPDNIRHDVFKAKIRYLEPVFELFLGFDWHTCFNRSCAFSVALGYEMQLWLNQTQTPFGVNVSISNERNLSLQGLTASLKLDF